jgi:serine phosphatase RsbU (regulator of sigma subunit)
MFQLIHPLIILSFIPHGHCYLWKPELLWLHISSDMLIALAYYSIPVTLLYFVQQRQDLPFNWIFLLFGAFIILCGLTHLGEVWTIWHPNYWISGFIKVITALVSVGTAITLVPLVPKALALPSPAQLRAANQQIQLLNEQLKSENLRLSTELEIAQQMQQMILPKSEELQGVLDLEIADYMEPTAEVGGDYYDVLYHDDGVTIGIGDVTGHGLESGILMIMTQTAVRTLKEIRESDPVKFLDTLNRTIYHNIQRMNSQRNLSLAVLNYSEGQLSISGQHEEIIIVRAGGEIERIDTIDLGFPIGLDGEIAEFINNKLIQLHSGDSVVLYTDGLTEAKNIDKVQYGLDRLCQVVKKNRHLGVQGIKRAVIYDVHQHIGSQKILDDLTLLVIKRK